MVKDLFKNREVMRAILFFIAVGAILSIIEYRFFSSIEQQAISAEFNQKADIRTSVISNRLEDKIITIGEELVELHHAGIDLASQKARTFILNTQAIPEDVLDITILFFGQDFHLNQPQQFSGKSLQHSFTHTHFYSRLIDISSTKQLDHHAHLAEVFPHVNEPGFDKVVQQALLSKQPQIFQKYVAEPVRSDFSNVFQVIFPFSIRSHQHQTQSGAGQSQPGLVILTLDFSASVLQAMNEFVKTPGGLDFYIYNDRIDKERLILFHGSRQKLADGYQSTQDAVAIPTEESLSKLNDTNYYTVKVPVLNQKWFFVFMPANKGFISTSSVVSTMIVVANFFVIVLLLGYVVQLLHNKGLFQNKVQEQNKELKETERALKEKTERVRSILDTVVDGIITINAKGKIQTVNPAALKMFGYEAHELIGQNIKILMPNPYQKNHDKFLENYAKTGEKNIIGVGREVQGKRKNGEVFPIELAVSEMSVSDEPMFTGVVRDITTRKHSEMALIDAKEQAEKASKAKSEFLSSMSHELRTPLNAILGYSQMIQYDSQVTDSVKKNTVEIYQAGEHLLTLINEVLELSHIETGNLELDMELCDVSYAIGQAISLMKPLAEKHNVILNCECLCVGWGVTVDKRRFKQIFLNLVSNAIKYNREHGEVTISCEFMKGNRLAIIVSDTGLGISETKLANIFKPFDRLGEEFGDIEGTGIGLTITKQLVEMLGGSLSIQSKLGKGSQFKVIFPAMPYAPEQVEGVLSVPDATSIDSIKSHEGSRILVAEDNKTNQNVISQQLDMLGYQYDIVADGQLAWEQLQFKDYDLLLTDIHMPNMNGIELIKKVRSIEPARNRALPIIAFTADALYEAKTHYFDVGIDDYLAKPVNLIELQNKLEQWLGHSEVNQEAPVKQAISKVDVKQNFIDIGALQRVVGDDYNLNCKILQNFIEMTPPSIELVTSALESMDLQVIQSETHKLKSSARTVGAYQLAETAEKIENHAKNSEESPLHELVPLLEDYMAQVKGSISDFCQLQLEDHAVKEQAKGYELSVAVVDDDPFILETVVNMLKKIGVKSLYSTDSAVECLAYVTEPDSQVNIVITDLNMPEMDGIELLRRLSESGYRGGIALISGEDSKVLKASERLAGLYDLNLIEVIEKPIEKIEVQAILEKFSSSATTPPAQALQVQFSATELKEAIEQNQLEVFYQPKVSLSTKVPLGMEALVRWQHPTKGMIPPNQFITLAEDNGLINELTYVVIEQAFNFTGELIKKGYNLKVSVNLSGESLTDLSWYDYLINEANQADLILENIVIEVTESRLMEDITVALEVLTRLTLQKIGVSIDDFGTGFSSLEQLQRIPFKELKLDQSFVRHSDSNQESQIILRSMVDMAKNLNLNIVAEGVETQAEWDLVKELGCDMAQGYFIAKPMDKNAFETWLKGWKSNLKAIDGASVSNIS